MEEDRHTMAFKHNDGDTCHNNTVTLHDCIVDKIEYFDGYLRFYLPDGLWVNPNHKDSTLDKTVRTNPAVVDFKAEDIDDITVTVFIRKRFGRSRVEYWDMHELMEAVNSGICKLEFVYQYRACFEQLWQCSIRSKKKPYYRDCQLHLPGTEAVYRWNDLIPEWEW